MLYSRKANWVLTWLADLRLATSQSLFRFCIHDSQTMEGHAHRMKAFQIGNSSSIFGNPFPTLNCHGLRGLRFPLTPFPNIFIFGIFSFHVYLMALPKERKHMHPLPWNKRARDVVDGKKGCSILFLVQRAVTRPRYASKMCLTVAMLSKLSSTLSAFSLEPLLLLR
jgi:hypothetical protein